MSARLPDTGLAAASLPDEVARDIVTGDLHKNLFVEAGAGSGKTTSLVKRVVNMVASGVPVGRIAAITFTEAAARELRVRVRDELEQQGFDRQDQLLVSAAGQVEAAAFTTLHGFALRLLADHPVEAGLPPGFGVADEIASMLDFDESWGVFVGKIGDDLALLDLQERAAILGVGLKPFADIARRFDDNWDLLAAIDHDPAPLSPIDLSSVFDELAALGGLADHCTDPTDRLATLLLELSDDVAKALDLDPLSQLEWLDKHRLSKRKAGRKGNWVGMDVEAVRARIAETREHADAALSAYRVEVINHFVALVAGFVESRVESRQSSGELAFHDLLVMARQLLRTNSTVREELHQRYGHVLLDEFQDTDPIQIELAVLIAAEGEVGDRPWQDLAAELQPGRLVVVGDPKQSIYRFRRADIRVYGDAESVLVDEPERLTANFRSVPGIVSWVNHFFGAVIGEGEEGAQPAYVALDAVREPDPERDVPVLAIGSPHDRPVGEIREVEAMDVAAVICRAIEEEWRIERDGRWSPVRLADIAVLIPSRLSLPALEAAFGSANLPFRPETSSLVYATQEVRDVLSGVRAVVDPTSSIDVVATLRSGLFAVADDDLLSWHLAERPWDYTLYRNLDRDCSLEEHPVARAFEVLARWHGDRWWTDPSALIERIVRERRLREVALAEGRPRDRWRRYRFLAEQAREFTATKGADLHDFVAWVEIQSSDLARVTEPIPAEPDDDAVRVLTVHGSKGLEFPMVILAGAPTMERNRIGGPTVVFPRGAAPEVSVAKGKSTQSFEIHASVEEVLDGHERIRLHYVAATRARDLLVVSAHHKAGARSMGSRTWEGLERCPDLWQRFEARGDEHYRIEPPTQLRLAGGDYQETQQVWDGEQQRLFAGNSAARTYSATGLAEELRPQAARPSSGEGQSDEDLVVALLDDASGAERQTWRQGRAGTALGIAVHATLQVVDFADPVGVGDIAAFHAEREGIAELGPEVTRYVEMALTAPAVEVARQRRHWRELYVAAPIGAALVEGYVDLCIDGVDGLIVVDYKTDLVASEADIEAKLEAYRIQGAVYAVALEHLSGQPVAECRFVFIGETGVDERVLAGLDDARREVRQHLTT